MSHRARVRALASVAAVAALYGLLLAVFKVVPRYDDIVFIGVGWGIFRLLDRASPRDRSLGLHLATQIFVVAYLVHLWTLGYEGRNAVFGGILPWSDSHNFYEDALRLAHGERFTEASSRRPIFSAAFAILLRFTGDLRVSLAICALIGAWATALASLEVFRTHGRRSALVVWLIMLFLERRWAGFIQTEHAGFPLGAIGFALVWRASIVSDADQRRARRLFLAGLFSLTLALMARAGAFFVLPALAFWAARKIERSRKDRLRFLGACVAAIALGFGSNKIVLSLTGEGVTFSDYAGIFYGAMHDQDYTYLAEQHPRLNDLPVSARVPEAWRIVLGEARAHPGLVITGFARSGAGLFVSPFGMFSYVWTNPDDSVLEDGAVVRAVTAAEGPLGPLFLWRRTLGTYSLLNAGAMGLLGGIFVLGTAWSIFVVFVRRRHDPELSLVRWAIAGVLVSAPFTPPWITSGQQVQTTTLAFVAALPAIVLFGKRRDVVDSPCEGLGFAPFAFVGGLIALIGLVRAMPLASPSCGGSARVLRVFPNTAVEVAEERSLSFRQKGRRDLLTSMRFLARHNRTLTDALAPGLLPGTVYVSAFDPCEGRAKIVMDDRRVLTLDETGLVALDADPLDPPKPPEPPKVLRARSLQRPVEP